MKSNDVLTRIELKIKLTKQNNNYNNSTAKNTIIYVPLYLHTISNNKTNLKLLSFFSLFSILY